MSTANGVKRTAGDEEKVANGLASPTKKSKVQSLPYDWRNVHEDYEAGKYAGTYGSSHAPYHALASVRVNKDLKKIHRGRSPDEFYVPEVDRHLQHESVRACWDEIVTMDPLGMYAETPTISATTARMEIPELYDALEADGTIVGEDKLINCIKLAIDYVWNIPGLAQRLKLDEQKMREALYEYTQNDRIMNPEFKTFLPPIGGVTVYFIGDVNKLHLKSTEVAVRVHDACCGSDVFGTDICTCRPYLVYAIEQATLCAQRGGVGLIIYYMKEGRSLGEVTKFRVYNARKAQKGGDTPEMYFKQTESIAGIRDARFQEMMPDVLLWLGVKRIDWLLSMSNEKYEGIVGAGIDVMQRRSLPDLYVPKGATVEITAKIASGYHSEVQNPDDIIASLRNLDVVRERCGKIYDLAQNGKSAHFRLDESKLNEVVDYVVNITKKNYPDLAIPNHSRWRHFDEKTISSMQAGWKCELVEKIRRKVDLATVSVLLDAGAGHNWKYTDENKRVWTRSEGIAVATLDMFRKGFFSSDPAVPHRVNSYGVRNLSQDKLSEGFQLSDSNTMLGLKARYSLLHRLAQALETHDKYFSSAHSEVTRPGHVVDWVLQHLDNDKKVSIRVLWQALIEGFENIWPEQVSGVRRGDVWAYTPLKKAGAAASDLVPFHKPIQWLLYSLLEPFAELGVTFTDIHLLTGLAEYRNGGLFVDMGVIAPKDQHSLDLYYDVGSEFVVEWRALTVILIDKVAELMRKALNRTAEELPIAKVLQGGTFFAGRAIAQTRRPEDPRSPPFHVRSDGVVF